MKPFRVVFRTAGCVLLLVAAAVLWPFRFSYDSVCSQCGAVQYTMEWQLPYWRHTIFTWSVTKPTSLSKYLTSSGTVTTHTHTWLFGHGGGNGVKCALGDGDLIRSAVNSPEAAHLLALSQQYGAQGESTKFLKLILDRNSSQEMLILARSVPSNGISSGEKYHEWIGDYNFLIDQATELAKQNK